jgi:hypothetical protein
MLLEMLCPFFSLENCIYYVLENTENSLRHTVIQQACMLNLRVCGNSEQEDVCKVCQPCRPGSGVIARASLAQKL